MRRYWIEQQSFVGSGEERAVIISGDSFRHICLVCRQEVGDEFEVLTDEGKAYQVKIFEKKKKQAMARVVSERTLPLLPQPYIELCVSLPKFNKFELILEKAVELSVSRVRPFFSNNSFVRSRSKVSDERFQRWKKIIMSATQQTGRGELMHLAEPCTLGELLEEFNQNQQSQGLFPYEGRCEKSLKQQLSDLKKQEFSSLWAFIGSEGGFDASEVELFKKNHLNPVTMGDQVLRVETACVSLASIIKYELLD